MSAALWGFTAWWFGPGPSALVAASFLTGLLTLSLIDIEYLVLPDILTLGLAANGFLNALAGWGPSPLGALAAACGAAGVIGLIVVITHGMGSGDICLAGAIGANLGPWPTTLALWVAMLLGGLVALVLLGLRRRGLKDRMPYGPILAAGAAVALFAARPF